MIPWIQVYANLSTHKKTCKLRDILGLKANYEAVGLLVCLWNWAAVNSPAGELTGYSQRDIADATGWKKAPAKLYSALLESGFLDQNEDGKTVIHDWEEHAALLMDSNEQQKKNTRERVRRYRERRKSKEETVENSDGNVTCNACNAPTLPNLTLPNLTLPNNNLCGDDDNAGAGAEQDSFLDFIGLKPGEFCGATLNVVNDVAFVTNKIMGKYFGREATGEDRRMVFTYTSRISGRNAVIDKDAVGLLEYACSQAVISGQKGNWRYITGILERLAARGIQTVQEAEAYDRERSEGAEVDV